MIGHAELKIGDSIFMVADEFPQMGSLSPKSIGGSASSLMIYTPDGGGYADFFASSGFRFTEAQTAQNSLPRAIHQTGAMTEERGRLRELAKKLWAPIAALGRHPHVSLLELDEVRDAEHWRRLGIPGSPYAIAIDGDGRVLAKGTFNSIAQLESVLASAERRLAESARA